MWITLLAAVALAGAPTSQAVGFTDVPHDHWAYAAVTHLKEVGILKGYPPGQ